MNKEELAKQANEILRADGFWKKKKDSRATINGRKRRVSRKKRLTSIAK